MMARGMFVWSSCLLLAMTMTLGCGDEPAADAGKKGEAQVADNGNGEAGKEDADNEDSGDSGEGADVAGTGDSDTSDGSSVTPGSIDLSPDNASIQFIGRHTDKSKDDRLGNFGDFSGKLDYDASSHPTSFSLDIKTDSIYAFNDQLTGHLKSPDFFDARTYPEAQFESSSIEAGEANGTVEITGQLTLLGSTQEVTFPATVAGSGDALTLSAEFEIDRTQWGMNYGVDNVEKMVRIMFKIGS